MLFERLHTLAKTYIATAECLAKIAPGDDAKEREYKSTRREIVIEMVHLMDAADMGALLVDRDEDGPLVTVEFCRNRNAPGGLVVSATLDCGESASVE